MRVVPAQGTAGARPPPPTPPATGAASVAPAPVGVVVNCQSDAASSVSRPSGIRLSDPSTVFESATFAGSIVPSTRLYVRVPITAAVIAPS